MELVVWKRVLIAGVIMSVDHIINQCR